MQLIFSCAYHKLEGKHVLFAQGFHCTGMPIKVRAAQPTWSILRPSPHPPRGAGARVRVYVWSDGEGGDGCGDEVHLHVCRALKAANMISKHWECTAVGPMVLVVCIAEHATFVTVSQCRIALRFQFPHVNSLAMCSGVQKRQFEHIETAAPRTRSAN